MKSRIKKILVSIQVFFLSMISKVFALSPYDIQTDYGIQTAYGIETPIEKAFSIGKFIVPIILFVIGLVVIISKKITKKVKIIIISTLMILGALAWTILNYFPDMF
mgnify:FL=1